MTRIVVLASIVGALLTGSIVLAQPAEASRIPYNCLNLTNAKSLDASAITKGLGLTTIQVREVEARLSQYNSIRGFPGLDGLDLTAAQIATINSRIAAEVGKSTHPLGWPCPAFKHRVRTVAFVRALVIGNGFTTYSVKFYGSAPRQIQFSGTLNGAHYVGAVVRSGVPQIALQLTSTTGGTTQTFTTPFDA